MDIDFWLERWDSGQTGFHQLSVNPYLEYYYGAIGPLPEKRAGLRVLVPLCGKSKDLFWLAENGYASIGIECSKLAVEHFFSENKIDFYISSLKKHVSYKNEKLEILLGDFFELQPEDIGRVTDIFDRASLISLPEKMRRQYVDKITHLQAPDTRTLLISLAYPQKQMTGPPFSVSDEEVSQLYSDYYKIEKLAAKNIIEDEPRFKRRGLTSLTETAYKLTRNG